MGSSGQARSRTRKIRETNIASRRMSLVRSVRLVRHARNSRGHRRKRILPEVDVGNKYCQSKNVTGQAGQVGQACEKFQRPSKETNLSGQGGQARSRTRKIRETNIASRRMSL